MQPLHLRLTQQTMHFLRAQSAACVSMNSPGYWAAALHGGPQSHTHSECATVSPLKNTNKASMGINSSEQMAAVVFISLQESPRKGMTGAKGSTHSASENLVKYRPEQMLLCRLISPWAMNWVSSGSTPWKLGKVWGCCFLFFFSPAPLSVEWHLTVDLICFVLMADNGKELTKLSILASSSMKCLFEHLVCFPVEKFTLLLLDFWESFIYSA